MNATNNSTPHEMRLLLRVSVLLPIASVFMLALTHIWQEAQTPDAHIAFLVVIAITPALIVYLPGIERRLGKRFLPIVLGVYLVCQTTLTAVLQNMSMARFDLMQVGPIPVVEPGVLLMIPLLLIAWQFGWKGALLASASAGTLHMLIGLAIHGLMPGNKQLSLAAPILRPDLLYFLPLVVAYLGGLLRRQQRHEAETHLRWREYAATAEVLAIDRERKRLAGELRQTVLDSLSGLAQQLGLLSKADPEPDALQTAQQLIREDMDTVGQLVSDLEATPLEGTSLEQALLARASALSQRTGVVVDAQVGELPANLTPVQELSLFHVADQALNHMVRHGGVSQVQLRLATMNHTVALTVHDDGHCRCHAAVHNEMDDLEAYANLIGGKFCFHQEDEQGNTVALWLPCP